MRQFKTFSQKPAEVSREWFLVDAAESATLGRLATEIAKILSGKSKVSFTPHVDNGDYVVGVDLFEPPLSVERNPGIVEPTAHNLGRDDLPTVVVGHLDLDNVQLLGPLFAAAPARSKDEVGEDCQPYDHA